VIYVQAGCCWTIASVFDGGCRAMRLSHPQRRPFAGRACQGEPPIGEPCCTGLHARLNQAADDSGGDEIFITPVEVKRR